MDNSKKIFLKDEVKNNFVLNLIKNTKSGKLEWKGEDGSYFVLIEGIGLIMVEFKITIPQETKWNQMQGLFGYALPPPKKEIILTVDGQWQKRWEVSVDAHKDTDLGTLYYIVDDLLTRQFSAQQEADPENIAFEQAITAYINAD